jgi:hypothetical protein
MPQGKGENDEQNISSGEEESPGEYYEDEITEDEETLCSQTATCFFWNNFRISYPGCNTGGPTLPCILAVSIRSSPVIRIPTTGARMINNAAARKGLNEFTGHLR